METVPAGGRRTLINDELTPWLRRTNDPFELPPLDTYLHVEFPTGWAAPAVQT